ncbi:hypothetical protein QF036_002913 [Arthrobacter globiformis]|nr:hypothetical protein [Arthrobacter globiformis]
MQFNHDNMHGVRLAESLVNMLADGMWDSDALKDLLTSHLFRSPRGPRLGTRESYDACIPATVGVSTMSSSLGRACRSRCLASCRVCSASRRLASSSTAMVAAP